MAAEEAKYGDFLRLPLTEVCRPFRCCFWREGRHLHHQKASGCRLRLFNFPASMNDPALVSAVGDCLLPRNARSWKSLVVFL